MKDDRLSRADLAERGWTDRLIAEFLGSQGQAYPRHLVIEKEASAEFRAAIFAQAKSMTPGWEPEVAPGERERLYLERLLADRRRTHALGKKKADTF